MFDNKNGEGTHPPEGFGNMFDGFLCIIEEGFKYITSGIRSGLWWPTNSWTSLFVGSICSFSCLFACFFVHVGVSVFVRLLPFVCVCLCVCLIVFVCLWVRVLVCLLALCSFVVVRCSFACLFVCLFACLLVCLFVRKKWITSMNNLQVWEQKSSTHLATNPSNWDQNPSTTWSNESVAILAQELFGLEDGSVPVVF